MGGLGSKDEKSKLINTVSVSLKSLVGLVQKLHHFTFSVMISQSLIFTANRSDTVQHILLLLSVSQLHPPWGEKNPSTT